MNKDKEILAFRILDQNGEVTLGLEKGSFGPIFQRRRNTHEETLEVSMSGMDTIEDLYLDWIRKPLAVGDELRLQVIKTSSSQITTPEKKRPVENSTDEQELAAYEILKKELEEAGLI